ncbi:OTU domain-containing protein 5-like [Leptinotarsa decemlineata]|uniref:OTU domain-containing protein 5-like n=1 Tax=Leptinotarsa decemlineata TaxID=7539 RepID=UPI003D306426
MENILVDNIQVPHKIVKMKGDGSCLFRAFSYILFENEEFAQVVRREVVNHVVDNWSRYEYFAAYSNGEPFRNRVDYSFEMLRSNSYGTSCEITAAAFLYNWHIVVYRNGMGLMEFGETPAFSVRLRFTGNLNGGHFDVLEENSTAGETQICPSFTMADFLIPQQSNKRKKQRKKLKSK